MTLSERGIGQPTVSLGALLTGNRPELAGQCRLPLADYVQQIVASGFPALRDLSPRARRFALDSHLRNAVDRDAPEQGLAVRRPEAMLAWMRAHAATTATTPSYPQLPPDPRRGHPGPERQASPIHQHRLPRRADPAVAARPRPRPVADRCRPDPLGQAPKHHLADPALAARLLGLDIDALLAGEGAAIGPQTGSLLGHLFHSLATLCLHRAVHSAAAISSISASAPAHNRYLNGYDLQAFRRRD